MEYMHNIYNEVILMIQQDTQQQLIRFLLSLFFLTILLIILSIILHEAGHLFFGLLTGFHFVFFRIFSISFIMENGGLKVKYYGIPGSIGQCIMCPTKPLLENPHGLLYTLGGIVADVLFTFVCLWISTTPERIPPFVRTAFFICGLNNIISILLNSFPRRYGSSMNDGLVAFCMMKDPLALKLQLYQLEVCKLLKEGKTYKEIPEYFMIVPTTVDYSNMIIAWHKILEYYYHLDRRHWDKAKECINILECYLNKYNKITKITIESEILFVRLLSDLQNRTIDIRYGMLQRRFSRVNLDFHTLRIKSVLEYLNSGKLGTLVTAISKMNKKKATYVYPGEAKFCIELLQYISDL